MDRHSKRPTHRQADRQTKSRIVSIGKQRDTLTERQTFQRGTTLREGGTDRNIHAYTQPERWMSS